MPVLSIMTSTINVKQALIDHETQQAKHIVAIAGAIAGKGKSAIIDRLNKLEAQKALNVAQGEINTGSSDSDSTGNVAQATESTVTVPPSIFSDDAIEITEIDTAQDLTSLTQGLTSISQSLANLEFLNG